MRSSRRQCLSLLAALPAWNAEQPALALANPAAPGSRLPYLAALPDGRLALSWTESPNAGPKQFLVSVLSAGQWSPPESIAQGDQLMLNWADFPSITSFAGGLAAHWLEREAGGRGPYSLRIALKPRGASAWKTAYSAPAGSSDGYTGFLSWSAHEDRLFATFLHNSPAGTRLRLAELRPDASLAKESLLDADVCSCCQTSASVTASGPILVYRDHTGPLRDISVLRFEKSGWSAPVPLHRDNWEINACPVNGPSIQAAGNLVAVAWYTGAQNNPRVLLSTSTDAGRSFRSPLRLDSGKPIGRVSLALLGNTPVVAWLERVSEQQAALLVRLLQAKNSLSTPVEVARVPAGRASGFPSLAVNQGQIYAAWTEDRIRTARLHLG